MDIEQKIRTALGYAGISQAELARRLGKGKSTLNAKIKRQTLTDSDMERIAEAIGGRWKAEFVFEDGTTI